MAYFSRTRKERDMRSNIPEVIKNSENLAGNDLITAFKIGKDVPKVAVSYGDELALNQPCVELEDMPTNSHDADSPLAELVEGVKGHFTNNENEEKKQEQPF